MGLPDPPNSIDLSMMQIELLRCRVSEWVMKSEGELGQIICLGSEILYLPLGRLVR